MRVIYFNKCTIAFYLYITKPTTVDYRYQQGRRVFCTRPRGDTLRWEDTRGAIWVESWCLQHTFPPGVCLAHSPYLFSHNVSVLLHARHYGKAPANSQEVQPTERWSDITDDQQEDSYKSKRPRWLLSPGPLHVSMCGRIRQKLTG